MAETRLQELLGDARAAEPVGPAAVPAPEFADDIPTFGDAWLEYLRVEKRRKESTIRDARNVARANLEPRFGRDTPLYAIDRHEVIVRRGIDPVSWTSDD